MDKACHVHPVGCYPTLKRDAVPIPATSWGNHKDMPSGRSQAPNPTDCMIPFIRNIQKRHVRRDRMKVTDSQSLGRGEWGVTANGQGFFWGQGRCSKLVVTFVQLSEYTKIHWFVHFKRIDSVAYKACLAKAASQRKSKKNHKGGRYSCEPLRQYTG